MLEIKYTSQFRKDVKQASRRAQDLSKLTEVVDILKNEQPLPANYFDHALKGSWVRGEWKGTRELHIAPNWLLVYLIRDNLLILRRTGSHSDLFDHSH